MAIIEDFLKLDIRIGKIVEATEFPEAKKPAYKLTIDFGDDIGLKKSSAQITHNYRSADLINMLVLCVVNFPPRKIGPFVSEVLTLGVPDEHGNVLLVRPDQKPPLGAKLF